MKSYQRDFLDYVIRNDILRFGEFTLKSGRISPYFFNAGLFNTGKGLAFIGQCYAQAIQEAGLDYDVIFGPAYKGIPLASSTAIALSEQSGINKPWCFNRKEAKDHGEGGLIVGAELAGRILIVDDVITAGTAIREVMELIAQCHAQPAAVLVALDRQERGQGELSAIQEIEREFNIPVVSIISLKQIEQYLETEQSSELQSYLPSVRNYQQTYGIQI